MSSKDDSALYTGITSVSARRVSAKKEIATDKKIQSRNELVPKADLVLDIIDAERDAIPTKIWGLTSSESTEESVRAMLGALRLYNNYLDSLRNQLQNVLRSKHE